MIQHCTSSLHSKVHVVTVCKDNMLEGLHMYCAVDSPTLKNTCKMSFYSMYK